MKIMFKYIGTLMNLSCHSNKCSSKYHLQFVPKKQKTKTNYHLQIAYVMLQSR